MSLEDSIYQEIVALVESDRIVLPTLPEIALKAREVAQDPDVSAAQLAKVVQNDPALTVRLLKVANSPLMRSAKEIDDLQFAISRMGITYAANLITALAMRQMFQATSDTVDKRMRAVWQHATTVAGIASVLCRHYTRLKPDQAALAGLVHEIGVLPILSFAESRPDLMADGITLNRVIDAIHPRLGTLILSRWHFPPELVMVPENYLRFDRQVTAADYVDLVTVADLESRLDTDHPLAAVDWKTVAAFARLGMPSEPDRQEEELQADKQTTIAILGC